MTKTMKTFSFGNADKKGVYFDEENRRHLNTIRTAYTALAMDLSEKNRKDDAKKVLEKADKMLDNGNFDYGASSRGNMHNLTSLRFMEAALMAGDTTLAHKVSNAVKKDLEQQIMFYNTLSRR
jgi:ABC-type glycerol-3-phosphate transport system substrate-binding protein